MITDHGWHLGYEKIVTWGFTDFRWLHEVHNICVCVCLHVG